jgi:dTDP-4-amino-4,6-dideoxygalactose transaminase
VVTDDDEIAARCRRLRDHGRLNKDVHAEIGFNLRFNEIQAAVGRVLLRRLDALNDRRRALAARYATGLAGLPLELPRERAGARHVYHLYVVRTPAADDLARRLAEAGIDTRPYYQTPVHRQPAMERWGAAAELPGTEQAARENLALPMGPAYGSDVADAVFKALQSEVSSDGKP